MPEYFVISLIIDDKNQTEVIAQSLFKKINMHKGKNKIEHSVYKILDHKEIIVSIIKWDRDFDEIFIAIPDQTFHEAKLQVEVKLFTNFITDCFQVSRDIRFALCAYEINASLIEKVKGISDMNDEFLSKFPIAYSRQPDGKPQLHINLAAQDIFTLFPCAPL